MEEIGKNRGKCEMCEMLGNFPEKSKVECNFVGFPAAAPLKNHNGQLPQPPSEPRN